MQSDSSNEHISQFFVYTEKKKDTTEVGLGGKVVNELVQSVKGKYHCCADCIGALNVMCVCRYDSDQLLELLAHTDSSSDESSSSQEDGFGHLALGDSICS